MRQLVYSINGFHHKLSEMDWGKPRRGLDLTPARRRQRLAWLRRHTHWILARWRNALYSDELHFQLHRAGGWQRVWRRTGERNAGVTVVRRAVPVSGGVLVWTGYSHGHRTQLHAIVDNLNAARYRDEILRPIVLPFVRQDNTIFHHDNARPHVTRVCREYLDDENTRLLDWSAYYPDLCPIEYVWNVIDQAISRWHPLLANNVQLRIAPQEEWTNIPQMTIENPVLFMQWRCAATSGKWRTHSVLIVWHWQCNPHRLIACDLAGPLY